MTTRRTPSPANGDAEQKLQEMIAALWDKSRPTVMERAAVLQDAQEQLAQSRLDHATQQSAVDSAHKLAGMLGLFGLPRGTEIAREAEVLFGQSPLPAKVEVDRLRGLVAELASLIERGPSRPN